MRKVVRLCDLVPREAQVPCLRISDDLRRKIEGGELLRGEQPPGPDGLSAEYGVSRAMAQRVCRVTADAGLVVTPRWWGVFVAWHQAAAAWNARLDQRARVTPAGRRPG